MKRFLVPFAFFCLASCGWVLSQTNTGVSGGGGAPTGAAGGDLTGTYPNPTIAANVGLTGAPTAPTAAVSTNTTQIASTAFVLAQAAAPGAIGGTTPAAGTFTSLTTSGLDSFSSSSTTTSPLTVASTNTGASAAIPISITTGQTAAGSQFFNVIDALAANATSNGNRVCVRQGQAASANNEAAWCWEKGATNSMSWDFFGNATDQMTLDTNGNWTVVGTAQTTKLNTTTNCASAASPAVCGSASAGDVAVPTGATPTLQINTTAITANSQIQLTVTEATTVGTRLSVTCNTTLSTLVNPVETARTAGASVTIQMNSTLAVNPACVHYTIVN